MNKIIGPSLLLISISTWCRSQDIVKVTNGAVFTVQSGATLYVAGGIVLDNNSAFNNAGTVTLERNANVTADLTDNSAASYNYGTGKFVFTGAGAQNIKSINQFERIEVANKELTLLSDIRSNTWYLKTGKVNTGAYAAIISNTAIDALQTESSNTNYTKSWINGSLRRYIAPAQVNSYQFPVGDAVKGNLAEMDNMKASPLTGVAYVTARFSAKSGTDAGLNAVETGNNYTMVNNAGVWHMVPDANPTGGNYDLKVYFNGFTGMADNSFAILHRAEASVNAVDWAVPSGSTLPASGMPGRTVADSYARRNSLASFGQFGLGSTLAVLPLQLLSFKAVKKGDAVVLEWTTDNEINTSHFELLRAGQSASLQYLDKVAAAGATSIRRNYSYTDLRPLNGTSFYQLKMVDKDDAYKLSQVVKVTTEASTAINVYPNPLTTQVLYVDHNGGKIAGVKLIGMDGKQVNCTYSAQGDKRIQVLIPGITPKGVYSVQLTTEQGVKSAIITIQ